MQMILNRASNHHNINQPKHTSSSVHTRSDEEAMVPLAPPLSSVLVDNNAPTNRYQCTWVDLCVEGFVRPPLTPTVSPLRALFRDEKSFVCAKPRNHQSRYFSSGKVSLAHAKGLQYLWLETCFGV